MKDRRGARPVHAVGIDLAWSPNNATGIAVVDADADGVAASILSLVDGRANVAEIADLAESSGLGPGEALRRIEELVETGVLRLVPADEAML